MLYLYSPLLTTNSCMSFRCLNEFYVQKCGLMPFDTIMRANRHLTLPTAAEINLEQKIERSWILSHFSFFRAASVQAPTLRRPEATFASNTWSIRLAEEAPFLISVLRRLVVVQGASPWKRAVKSATLPPAEAFRGFPGCRTALTFTTSSRS